MQKKIYSTKNTKTAPKLRQLGVLFTYKNECFCTKQVKFKTQIHVFCVISVLD